MAEGAAVGGEDAGEGLFAGMAEGGMAKVVAQGYRLGEVFVEVEGAGYGAGDLHHLEGMGKAGSEVVTVWRDKDLGLVHEAAKRLRVDYAVSVALEIVSYPVRRFGPLTSRALNDGPGGGP